jgi:hypothetical protein
VWLFCIVRGMCIALVRCCSPRFQELVCECLSFLYCAWPRCKDCGGNLDSIYVKGSMHCYRMCEHKMNNVLLLRISTGFAMAYFARLLELDTILQVTGRQHSTIFYQQKLTQSNEKICLLSDTIKYPQSRFCDNSVCQMMQSTRYVQLSPKMQQQGSHCLRAG